MQIAKNEFSRMNKRILKVVRWILLVWGGLSLAGAIAFAAFIAFNAGPDIRDRNDVASSNDVRFVLNWCELGDKRIEKVVHSHVSARSLTGDHLDAYAIKISHINLAELASKTDQRPARWYRGDQLPKVLDDAVGFTGDWLKGGEISWFPREAKLRSTEFYVYPWRIDFHGVSPRAVQLIFVRPSDKMVFYFEAKM